MLWWMLFITIILIVIWSMVEMVSPQLAYKLYRRVGMSKLSEKAALRIIRIDGFVSWLLFTVLAAWIFGKL